MYVCVLDRNERASNVRGEEEKKTWNVLLILTRLYRLESTGEGDDVLKEEDTLGRMEARSGGSS
jgi:hypothetical protein